MTLQYEQDIPKKNLLDKSLSYMISFLSRDVGYYLYVTAHDKTKY